MFKGTSASVLARQLKERLSHGQYLSIVYLVSTGVDAKEATELNVDCGDDDIVDFLDALKGQGLEP